MLKTRRRELLERAKILFYYYDEPRKAIGWDKIEEARNEFLTKIQAEVQNYSQNKFRSRYENSFHKPGYTGLSIARPVSMLLTLGTLVGA